MTSKGNTAMAAPTVTPVGTWTLAGDLPSPTAWNGQHDGPVLLDSGDVLVAGGTDTQGFSVPDTAVFDTEHRQWHPAAGNLHAPRRLHTLTRLPNGKVLAVGGLNGPTALASAELFDPGTGQPLAVIDAAGITDMRTGAVTALGARHLAPRGARVLGHVGARGTAYWNVRLTAHVLGLPVASLVLVA